MKYYIVFYIGKSKNGNIVHGDGYSSTSNVFMNKKKFEDDMVEQNSLEWCHINNIKEVTKEELDFWNKQ